MFEDDSLKEYCGVFGVFGHKEAAKMTNLGLYALQHRGQESAGIVSHENNNFYIVKDMGLVSEIFNQENLSYLKGKSAIGHVRYSTTGSPILANIQPLYSKTNKGKIAIAHNGNLTNAFKIYEELKADGALFQSTVDTEVILHLIARSKKSILIDAVKEAFTKIEGAFSILLLGDGFMMAIRDPLGFRPLVLGKIDGSFVVSSETCALDLIGAEYVREVKPGEIIYIDEKTGLSSHFLPKKKKQAFCIFEHIYFARPDSIVYGELVHNVRKEFGRILAKEYPVEADLVIAIPDSGNSAALGFSEVSGLPFDLGMIRNHYIGRTFIEPDQKIRDLAVKIKLNPISGVLKDKRVVVIDDSIVRGTTSRQRINAIRKAGAKEIHLRVASPPICFPCFFGIDTPKRAKLIAAHRKISEIRRYIDADSLGYLSLPGMLSAIKNYPSESFCTSCFSGNYPLKICGKGKYSMEGKNLKLYSQKY
jgi:amidophosphoribosyltransferase